MCTEYGESEQRKRRKEKEETQRGEKGKSCKERYNARTKEENSRKGRNVVGCPRKWAFCNFQEVRIFLKFIFISMEFIGIS
jgi:hypothetical protein